MNLPRLMTIVGKIDDVEEDIVVGGDFRNRRKRRMIRYDY